jgi:L-lactate dehydrogenase complex protein LldE
MRVALFIPCYIDQFFPDVAWATLELLERCGCRVEFPDGPTCCGQPMANTGCTADARPLAEQFLKAYRDAEYVVCPSGSCTAMVTHHYDELLTGQAGYEDLQRRCFELTQFLVEVVRLDRLEGVRFPHRVGLHNSCHGLRELRLGRSSEQMTPDFSTARALLGLVEGLDLVELDRPDECCGFGGTFAVTEEAVSCMMGRDRIHDHRQAGADVIVAGDMSCLMHLDGLIRREARQTNEGPDRRLRVMHIAQVLRGRPLDANG